MTTATRPKSGYEKWQDGINKAVGDAKWDAYDCEIKVAVNEFNHHLTGTAGYLPLNWELIKAMMWTETGAESPAWQTKPIQIGVARDPGLTSFLSGKEGGELILPASWRNLLSAGTATSMPSHNIRAGIGYMLMRMANFEYKTIPDADTKIYEVTVKPGDSLDKIAKINGSTPDMLKKLNPSAMVLHPKQVLKYQKASVQRVISSWRTITTSLVAQRYNGGRDPNYAKKLDYALALIRKGKAAICTQ